MTGHDRGDTQHTQPMSPGSKIVESTDPAGKVDHTVGCLVVATNIDRQQRSPSHPDLATGLGVGQTGRRGCQAFELLANASQPSQPNALPQRDLVEGRSAKLRAEFLR